MPQIIANINASRHIARDILAAFIGEGVGVGVGIGDGFNTNERMFEAAVLLIGWIVAIDFLEIYVGIMIASHTESFKITSTNG